MILTDEEVVLVPEGHAVVTGDGDVEDSDLAERRNVTARVHDVVILKRTWELLTIF